MGKDENENKGRREPPLMVMLIINSLPPQVCFFFCGVEVF